VLRQPVLNPNKAQHTEDACTTVLKRALGYARVASAARQSGPEHHTRQNQRASIQRTAPNHGDELVDVLSDEDQSRISRNPPQIGIAMRRILAGEADAIIDWKASRFPRNWSEAAEDRELPQSDAITDRAATSELVRASLARTRHLRSRPHCPNSRCTNSLHAHPHSMVHCHHPPRREQSSPLDPPGPSREPGTDTVTRAGATAP